MGHHSYTRKIQIQDSKKATEDLFSEEEKQPKKQIDKVEQKSSFFRSPKKIPKQKERRRDHLDHYQLDETDINTQIRDSFERSGRKIHQMYHSKGSFDFFTKILSRISNHILSGRTIRTVQHYIHYNIFNKEFENMLFKTPAPNSGVQQNRSSKPVSVHLLKTILANLPDKLNHFHFVDMNAGAGRALLMASCFPFQKVIGFEQTPALHDISRSNLAHFPRSLMKCRDVSSSVTQTTDVTLPSQKTVFFFHQSSDPEAYQDMIRRITESYKAHPRRIYLIFIEPMDSQKLEDFITHNHVYEPLKLPALLSWRCRLFNPFKVQIFATVYQERS